MSEGISKLMTVDQLSEAAECLKVLAHPIRLRLIQLIKQDQFTVGELAELCAIQSHVASEHLRLMQRCGLLNSEKDGRKVYYFIAQEEVGLLLELLEMKFGN
ncbi:MAG: winged helix-turn-helix transcriptional regulator [Lentisphaeria bacterium]|nr:metalloregulator ArsR/SmtB family transcription factor [Lentisphaeria bacterium]NQZ67353.1 winged helix-turn-helix transcriptional regulator [Lentisphaeria bacterium]